MRFVLFSFLLSACAFGQDANTLTNPLLRSGPDPWIVHRDGYYYFVHSVGHGVAIRKTANLGALRDAADVTVWTAPAEGPYSREVWAPEMHYLNGAWYIYFAADAGTNQTHRMWVIENRDPDPATKNWTFKGKVADPTDKWAIDATVFEARGRLYMIWSGWEGDRNGTQSLYIGELANPWTMKGKRVRISTPEYPWEKVGDLTGGRNVETNPAEHTPNPAHVDVNEGPAVLKRNGKVFVVYSAAGCWTDYYSLGMLTANDDADLMNAASWSKSPRPLLWQSAEARAFGTGHNSFFQSPDGKQDWIIYHANPEPGQGCGRNRSPRAQPFGWKADGTPDFGRPLPIGKPIPAPGGEPKR